LIRTIIAVAFCFGSMPAAALVGFPWTFISGRVDFLYNMAMNIVRVSLYLAGVKIAVRGTEKFDPAGTYIFMCNHVSNLDPPILVPKLPGRTTVLVKKELFKIPILGPAMHLANLVPVDRSNREAAIASVQTAVEVLKTGIHMTIFPEGTRSPDGRLRPFKKGPFYLASESGLSIVPVTIGGTETMMPKGSSIIHPGMATLTFHAPVDPKRFADKDDLMAAVRAAIASALTPEQLPERNEMAASESNSADAL
jgi:1-acyl-sn-glycerol-3-phosphate acyltransferase